MWISVVLFGANFNVEPMISYDLGLIGISITFSRVVDVVFCCYFAYANELYSLTVYKVIF